MNNIFSEMEQQELNRLVGKKAKSKDRAFKKIKEKYDIEEHPVEPVVLDSKTHSFKVRNYFSVPFHSEHYSVLAPIFP